MTNTRSTSKPVTVRSQGDIYLTSLSSVASIVAKLVRKTDVISNPISQLYGNTPLNSDFTVEFTLLDDKVVTIPLDSGFVIVPKNQASNYQGNLVVGKVAEKTPRFAFLKLFAYLLCTLVSGKMQSGVQGLRGGVLNEMINHVKSIKVTQHEWVGGGKQKGVDVVFTDTFLRCQIQAFNSVYLSMLKNPDKSGHTDEVRYQPIPTSKNRKVTGLSPEEL